MRTHFRAVDVEFLHHPARQDMTISDIMNSAFGSAGQRCMAASILIIVGKGEWERGKWKIENQPVCGWTESWEFKDPLLVP